MENLKNIFQIIIIIGVVYIMNLSLKAQREERKKQVAKLKQQGKAVTPKQIIFYFFCNILGDVCRWSNSNFNYVLY